MEALNISKAQSKESIILNRFVAKIISTFQYVAISKKNHFINDIEPYATVSTDAIVLRKVLSNILNSILRQCENCDIRLSAKMFHCVVLMHITIIDGFQGVLQVDDINEINDLTEVLGGCLLYNNQHLKESTFSLCFLNNAKLAA